MGRAWLGLLAVVPLLACQPKRVPPPATPPPDETKADEPEPEPEPLPEPETEPPPAEPKPCAEGGRLWSGTMGDCSYEHAGCCYDSAATACAAAGCDADRCNVLESYPAQIVCGS